MRIEAKRRQREDRRLNILPRNKSFTQQFGCEEDTPYAETRLEFWRRITIKKSVKDGKTTSLSKRSSGDCERSSIE